ncbi:hypothetical protein BGX26_003109, partial [Mortierella sp. AD094]
MTNCNKKSRDITQIGKEYIQKGDQCRDRGDFKKATNYYEKAIAYCPNEARDRLRDLLLRKAPLKGKSSSAYTSSGWGAYFKRAKESFAKMSKQPSRNFDMTGPYFPMPLASAQDTLVLQTSPATHILDDSDSIVDCAPSTSSLVASFIRADITTKTVIRSHIQQVIKQFDNNSISGESIQELVVLSTIPDQEIFLNIINQLFTTLRDAPIIPNIVLQGLAVILNTFPEEIDPLNMHDAFLDILGPISDQLKVIHLKQNEGQLLPLLRALSSLFNAMVCRGVLAHNCNRTLVHIKRHLDILTSHENIMVSFLAFYAKQALAYIGNDKSLAMNIFRRGKLIFAIAGNIKGIDSGLDLNDFETAYQNFTEICDFSVRSAWYQGLIYLDCVMDLQDWQRFESFVLKSKLRSNERFLQGACLRLEQIAATQTNDGVRYGAIKFLHVLGATSLGLVQQFVQIIMSRLCVYGETNHSIPGTMALIIPRPVSYFLPQVFQDDVTPIWNPIWQATPSDILLKVLKDKKLQVADANALSDRFDDPKVDIQSGNSEIMNTTEDSFSQLALDMGNISLDTVRIAESLPTQSSLYEVNIALEGYYKPFLTIQRVSGDSLSLESCYINLAIVEALDQRQKDKEELKAKAAAFYRMPSFDDITKTDVIEPIPLEKLFDKRRLRDGKDDIPKTILIQGRAGIGKTTLCKKLVHAYQGGLWRDRFDAVLWLPLRQLKAFRARNLEDLLRKKYFEHRPKQEKEALAYSLTALACSGTVLFILDGLDEILADTQTSEGIALEAFLKHLLQQDHVIVTSRPSGVDMSILATLDLELEIVGFTTQNVSDYLSNALTPDATRAVRDFIRQTPLIQGLVNIPAQLDVICYSWDSIPASEHSVTMTGLYQGMVRKLWCKDAARLQKSKSGKELTPRQIKILRPYQIDQLMAIESEYLGYLAFKGMRDDHQIEFDESMLCNAIEELDYLRNMANQEPLPFQLLDTLKQTSFLHTADADLNTSNDMSQRAWYFLHLTFQEYFAATWIARHLQSSHMNSSSNTVLDMTVEQTVAFIQKHKYNPRYEVVWWMVAGLLEGKALELFFDLIQEKPHDLVGGRHQLLLAGCLKETRRQLDNGVVSVLEVELTQWLNFEMATYLQTDHNIILGRQSVLPEELLIKCINQTTASRKYALKAFKGRSHLTSSAIECLISLMHDSDLDTVMLVIDALGAHSALSESATLALVSTLHNGSWDFRSSAARVLSNQIALSDSVIQELINDLRDGNSELRGYAAQALGTRSALPDSALLALTSALLDEYATVRSSAARSLCNHRTLSEFTIQVLIGTLDDRILDVRYPAAKALGNQLILSDPTIMALVGALHHESSEVKSSAAQVLGTRSTLLETPTQGLIGALYDGNGKVRTSAAEALRSQFTLSDSTIQALISALHYEDAEVRGSAAYALGTQSKLPESAIEALIDTLYDENSGVRSLAASTLGAQSTLSRSITQALIDASQDENSGVRISTLQALGAHATLSEAAMQALISALQDESSYIRLLVTEALGAQSTLSQYAIQALMSALYDQDLEVRNSAAKALGERTILPESTIQALVAALSDGNPGVRGSAARALGTQSTISEPMSLALVNALVRDVIDSSAQDLLRALPRLSRKVIQALVEILECGNEYVRDSVRK